MNLTELRHLGRYLAAGAEAAMKTSAGPDLNAAEILVLQTLFTTGALPVGEIAQHTGFAQSRASTAVASLHDKDLVDLSRDPADRRRTVVSVSEHARTRARTVENQEAAPVVARLFPAATPDDLTRLMEVLGRLHAAIADPAPAEAPSPSPN